MDIIIKLLDGCVTKIETDSEYELEKDYYGYNVNLLDEIDVYFLYDGGLQTRLRINAKDVQLTDFLSFFYGVDFSGKTVKEFSDALINHLGGINQYCVVRVTEEKVTEKVYRYKPINTSTTFD